MMRRLLALCAVTALTGCAEPQAEPAPETPRGVFGRAPAAVGGIPSVVSLEPFVGGRPGPRDTLVMDQLGLQFSPRLMLVRAGSVVRFTNSETLAHNVRLTRDGEGEPFLDQDTDPGAALAHTLADVGAIDVTCSLHPGMTAFIYVHDATWAVFAETDGSFEIVGVPEGSYRLNVWSVGSAEPVSAEVEVTGPATEVSLPSGG